MKYLKNVVPKSEEVFCVYKAPNKKRRISITNIVKINIGYHDEQVKKMCFPITCTFFLSVNE